MKLRSATSSGAPRFCSLNSVRNSWPSGSGISSPIISRLMEKAWPARMERARKSSASGNCSSRLSSRFVRLCRTNRYGSSADSARATPRHAVGRTGSMTPSTAARHASSAAMAASRRVERPVQSGLLDHAPAACREKCSD